MHTITYFSSLQLNDYDTRVEAIEAVRKIKYTMGATNTAAAIRLARTTMFTSAMGDRSSAQNLAIIITGANSTGIVSIHEHQCKE